MDRRLCLEFRAWGLGFGAPPGQLTEGSKQLWVRGFQKKSSGFQSFSLGLLVGLSEDHGTVERSGLRV